MVGRKIGDEYQYILDRKYAQKYPGNMLDRPSLLNNPWAIRTTDNNRQNLTEGNKFAEAGADRDGKDSQSTSEKRSADEAKDFANLDFLGNGVPMLANLRPNEKGTVTIPRELLSDAQHIRIVVINGSSTIQRTVNLPLQDFTPRDSRLVEVLPADQHFTQTKQIDFLQVGDTLKIKDIVSSRFRHYDDLADIYRYYSASSRNTYLTQFNFILDWPKLKEEEKQAMYSKFACHELNFFLYKKDPAFFCLLYTSPSPRDLSTSRMPSSA